MVVEPTKLEATKGGRRLRDRSRAILCCGRCRSVSNVAFVPVQHGTEVRKRPTESPARTHRDVRLFGMDKRRRALCTGEDGTNDLPVGANVESRRKVGAFAKRSRATLCQNWRRCEGY